MGVLVLLLVVTNLVTLGVLGWLLLRPVTGSEADEVVGAALDGAPRPRSATGTRRVISVEILNPIELAGTRGRVAGIAGSLAPGITKRVVHEQALKQMRRDLRAEGVLADVRLHTIRPVSPVSPVAPGSPVAPVSPVHPAPGVNPGSPADPAGRPVYFDEVQAYNYDDLEDRGA